MATTPIKTPVSVETTAGTKPTNQSKKNFRNLRIEVPKAPIREFNSLSVGSANYYSTDVHVSLVFYLKICY